MSVCGHGQLKRSCELCEKDERIAELEAEWARCRKYYSQMHKQVTDCLKRADETSWELDIYKRRIRKLEAENVRLVAQVAALTGPPPYAIIDLGLPEPPKS